MFESVDVLSGEEEDVLDLLDSQSASFMLMFCSLLEIEVVSVGVEKVKFLKSI